MTQYLKNTWYQAGWSDELPPYESTISKPLARTICEVPIVFFRTADGAVTALFDRCPHRFAPLSAGRAGPDRIACGYHGLEFGVDGNCVHNPHGPVVSALTVRSFPVIERHTAIWVWLGDAERADPALLPDLGYIDETPAPARIVGYMPTMANYQLLTDNILDLSHADYLHPTSLGGFNTAAKTTNRQNGNRVRVDWLADDCVAPPAFRAGLNGAERADMWIEVVWQAPALMTLTFAASPAGAPRRPEDEGYTLHNMVPETATTTHYFYCATRRFKLDDERFSGFLKGALAQAFNEEDKPMLELQQARIGSHDFWDLEPVLLKIDGASTRVRRTLQAMIEAEAHN